MDILMKAVIGKSRRERTINIALLLGLVFTLLLLIITSVISIIVHQDLVQQTSLQSTQASKVAANAYPAYLPGNGKLFISDPLQQENHWLSRVDRDFGGSCQFQEGAMHARQEKPGRVYGCSSFRLSFANFALEVQMTTIQGDCGNVDVRATTDYNKYYDFMICQDGTYQFAKYLDGTGKNTVLFASGSHFSIKKGLRQTNLVAIYANKDILRFFVNGQQIAMAQDGDFTKGSIVLSAFDSNNATEVVYKQARVWTLN